MMNTQQKPSGKFFVNQSAQLLSNLIGIRLHLTLNDDNLTPQLKDLCQDANWMCLHIQWESKPGRMILMIKKLDLLHIFPHFAESLDTDKRELITIFKRYLQALASHMSFFSTEHWEIKDLDVLSDDLSLESVEENELQVKKIHIQLSSELIAQGYLLGDRSLVALWSRSLKNQHIVELESFDIVGQSRLLSENESTAQLALHGAFGKVTLNPDQMHDLQPYAILPFHADNNEQVYLFYNHHKIAEAKVLEWGDPLQIQIISITENGQKILSQWSDRQQLNKIYLANG